MFAAGAARDAGPRCVEPMGDGEPAGGLPIGQGSASIGGMPKEDLPKNQPSESRDLVRAGIGGRENLSLPAEVIQALESTSSSVDINVLLVQMIQKDPDPSEFLEQFEKIIGLVQRVEAGRLENFRERANAV